MEAEFWRAKWREDRQGWRQPEANPMLARHLASLGLAPGARVFAPLCGDSVDVGWLVGQGFRVVGVELVAAAVERLFVNLGMEPVVSQNGALTRYSAKGLDVLVGDLFEVTAEMLGPVDATYDRAALVALPAGMRRAYAAHVAAITAQAPQLLITFDYDQSRMEGPPFSVTEEEVRALYGETFDVEPLESAEIPGGLKGFCPAAESAWRLTVPR